MMSQKTMSQTKTSISCLEADGIAMSKSVHWYRVKYFGAWDLERKVHVAYVHTPEAALLDEVKKALWQQHDLRVPLEDLIHVLDCEPVERDYTPEEYKVVP